MILVFKANKKKDTLKIMYRIWQKRAVIMKALFLLPKGNINIAKEIYL